MPSYNGTYLQGIRSSFARLRAKLSFKMQKHPLIDASTLQFDVIPDRMLSMETSLDEDLQREFSETREAATEILEKLVHRSELERRRMEIIFDSLEKSILIIDKTCTITAANRTTRQLFGAQSLGTIGRQLNDFLPGAFSQQDVEKEYAAYCEYLNELRDGHGDDELISYDLLKDKYADYLRTQKSIVGVPRDLEYRRFDGAVLHVRITLNVLAIDPFSEDFGYLLTVEDMTESHKTLAEVNRLQHVTESLLALTPTSTFQKDLKLKFTSVNNTFRDLVQLTDSDILGMAVTDMFDADSSCQLTDLDKEALNSNDSKYGAFTIRTLAGSEHSVRVFTCAVRDGGVAVGITGAIVTDSPDPSNSDTVLIDDRVTSQTRNFLFEAAARAIIFLDSDLRVTGCNDEFTRLIGISKDKIIGLSSDDALLEQLISKTPTRRVSDIIIINGKPIRRRSTPLQNSNGTFEGLVCIYFMQFSQE